MIAGLLAAALVFSPSDARLAYETASNLVTRCTPRDAGTIQGHLAADFIYNAINATGLDARLDSFKEMTPAGERLFINVESEYRSDPDAPWVVLVSHYDTKPGTACPGANDGASTTGLLVAVGNALFDNKPKGLNVLLLWTDGEESRLAYGPDDGLWGSRHAAQKLKDEQRKVLCVVCLDMLGDTNLKIGIPRNGSPGFRRGVIKLAGKIGLASVVEESDEIVCDDHVPFLDAGFKAIDLIDFCYGSAPGLNDYWHTPQDTIDKISVDSLMTAGSLVIGILEGLHH